MKCKFCGDEKKLIKAHIIPEAFFTLGGARLLSSLPDVHPKRAPIGVYDPNILCADCDQSFGFLDQHVIENLLNTLGEFYSDGEIGFRRYPQAVPEIVRLFALSVAWRAHHSTHEMFANVNMGPHEPSVKADLARPLDHKKVGAFVHEFDRGSVPIIGPIPERYDNVRFLRIYTGRLIFSVKLDQRPMPPDLNELDLLVSKETTSIVVPWAGSAEASLAIDIVSGSAPNRKLANQWRKETKSRDPMSVFRLAAGRLKPQGTK